MRYVNFVCTMRKTVKFCVWSFAFVPVLISYFVKIHSCTGYILRRVLLHSFNSFSSLFISYWFRRGDIEYRIRVIMSSICKICTVYIQFFFENIKTIIHHCFGNSLFKFVLLFSVIPDTDTRTRIDYLLYFFLYFEFPSTRYWRVLNLGNVRTLETNANLFLLCLLRAVICDSV